jgi:hypothetical protein
MPLISEFVELASRVKEILGKSSEEIRFMFSKSVPNSPVLCMVFSRRSTLGRIFLSGHRFFNFEQFVRKDGFFRVELQMRIRIIVFDGRTFGF